MNIAYLLSSFFITGFSLLALKPLATKVGLVDIPGGRKTHTGATPLVGGLGIFLGILCVSTVTPGVLSQFGPLLSLSALVLFMGTVDDAKELSAFARLTGHTLLALVMAVAVDVQLTSLGNLFYLGTIDLGLLSITVTVFATVGVINAINMADGIDGLSGGLVIVALGFIALLALNNNNIQLASFVVVMICSISAFLSLNFRRPWNKKALIYLGDAGSTMLGFMLAWLMIESSQGAEAIFAPVYALWFLAVPLFDTINLLIKRPLRGVSPVTPGTDHLHHALLSRGLSVVQVVTLLLAVSVSFGGIALVGRSLGVSESSMFLLFICLFAIYFAFSDRIRVADSNTL
ncbi:MAG: undecaprenyl-phosphate alpha-N-acetylglucosaminyl 1-phosphate transferase [SAR86 cluster bacterium]|uniref:Undecaprenyl-phosphate alpha-N-acetylglucosaminyl 1-phosphate transferase n=1 Tax=SAR86 cluster bacterium TaxID=2030880 RepID=A0A2A4WXY6_9GAMM|nr:MAG: undecaprenyl-phosphate alpha-N-acetylglucosaminyl 1-phosphate transferase [SAR86 cluster bacterium]